MTSDNWTNDDLRIGSISSDQVKTDVGLGIFPAEAVHNGADGYIPFQFSSSQTSPLLSRNSYGHNSIISSPDLNMTTDTVEFNSAPDMNYRNDAPYLDYHIPTFSGTGVNVTSTLGCQTPANSLTAYHCTDRGIHFGSAVGPLSDRSFINASRNEPRNFHMSGLHEETKNNSNQLTDINRIVTNFVPEIPQKQDILQRADDFQVKANAFPLDSVDKLDGRFLSLGSQGNSSFDIQSNAGAKNASKITPSCFPSYSQSANSSFNNLDYNLSEFQNLGSIMNREHTGDLALINNSHDIWPTTARGFDGSTTSVLPGGETNMHRFIPTPRSRTSENEMESMFTLDGRYNRGCGAYPATLADMSSGRLRFPDPMQGGIQRFPYNSSVLRSNHQNASDQSLISYMRPNLDLPPYGGITGQPGQLDQSGFAGVVLGSTTNPAAQTAVGDVAHRSHMVHPSIRIAGQVDQGKVVSYAEAGKGYDFEKGAPQLASQGATCNRESLKRRLHPTPPALTQDQRRKIMPQTSTYPYSPNLLQNALGQIGKHMTSVSSCSNPSLMSTTPLFKGPAARGSTKNQTAFPASAMTIRPPSTTARALMPPFASAETFISPELIPVTSSASQGIYSDYPSAKMSFPASFANFSPNPETANEVPIFSSPTVCATSAMVRTTPTTGLDGIPFSFNSSNRVIPETTAPSHILAPVAVSRKTLLPRTSSARTIPAVNSLRRSLPGLGSLAKASPILRASPGFASSQHIKRKGIAMSKLSGVKCLLCNRDLSYTPEGPISVPPIPPPVAILPCGHTFHDHCLLLITPSDQSKNPPCIPCAMSEN